MKKIYFISILIFGGTIILKAQTENKGAFEIGGSTKAGISLNFEDGIVNANLSPFVGYYLTNNLVLGAGITMHHARAQSQIKTNYTVGPFLKYYLFEKGNIRPYFKFQTAFGQYISKYEFDLYKSHNHNINSFSLNTGIGLSCWIKPNIALTTELNYSYYKINKLTSEDNSLNLNFGLLFKLGK